MFAGAFKIRRQRLNLPLLLTNNVISKKNGLEDNNFVPRMQEKWSYSQTDLKCTQLQFYFSVLSPILPLDILLVLCQEVLPLKKKKTKKKVILSTSLPNKETDIVWEKVFFFPHSQVISWDQ